MALITYGPSGASPKGIINAGNGIAFDVGAALASGGGQFTIDSSGPLAVVARYATPQMLKDFGLDETHTAPFEHWLMAKFGDVLRDPDPQGYLAWRESCRRVLYSPESQDG